MTDKLKRFVVMLIISSMIIVPVAPAYAEVETKDEEEVQSTLKEVALTIKEIASLAVAIAALYRIISSLGESFSTDGLGIAASVGALAYQAGKYVNTMSSAIDKVEEIDDKTSKLMEKFQTKVGEGEIGEAQGTFTELVALREGAPLAETLKHRQALEYMRFSNATAAIALADACRNQINIEGDYKDAMEALAATTDMTLREGFGNELKTKQMVVQSACSISLEAAAVRMRAMDVVVGTNLIAGTITAGSASGGE